MLIDWLLRFSIKKPHINAEYLKTLVTLKEIKRLMKMFQKLENNSGAAVKNIFLLTVESAIYILKVEVNYIRFMNYFTNISI